MIWGSKEFGEWWVHENGTPWIELIAWHGHQRTLPCSSPCEDKGEIVSLQIRRGMPPKPNYAGTLILNFQPMNCERNKSLLLTNCIVYSNLL